MAGFCHLVHGSGDGQKQVGTDGDFVGEKLAHAHQLRPPRRHGVDLGRGNVAWCLGQIAKKSAKNKIHKIREIDWLQQFDKF